MTTILWVGEPGPSAIFTEKATHLFKGGKVVHEPSAEMVLQRVAGLDPLLVAIDTPVSDLRPLPAGIKSLSPETSVMVLAERKALPSLMIDLMDHVDEFVGKPVKAVEMEVALRRAGELARLRRRVKSAPGNSPDPVMKKDVHAFIEQERFVTIKQIAKSLSSFMGQIASHAQGGLRYFDEMPYLMAIHSRQCRVLTINSTYRKYLGDKVNHPSWEIYKNADRGEQACPVRKTIDTGAAATTRAVVRYHDGKEVPVLVHTSPVVNREGDVELVLEVFAGVKEIDRMAQDIKTTQQRYRQLFDAVPNYIAVLDTHLRLTAFNRRFLEDFGFKTGHKFYDIFRPMRATAHEGPIAGTLKDGMQHQGEMTLYSPQGDPLNLMAWTSPITTAAGKLIQVLVIFTDVTELRRLQDNLSQLGLMISTVTHSLKGSLTGLDAGLYMIGRGFYRDQPGRIEEGLDVATAMTDRLRKIVRDILYYAKERKLAVEDVDAAQFAADIASGIETRVRGANIEFKTHFGKAAGGIEIDPGLIRASLVNILENAMEACIEDEAGKSNWIEFSVTGATDHVIFTITDNGIGIGEDQIHDIFKLFWSSKGKSGTGLGLFITNNVVGKHGGRITATSQPGEQTRFTVRLPRKIKTER